MESLVSRCIVAMLKPVAVLLEARQRLLRVSLYCLERLEVWLRSQCTQDEKQCD